MVDYGKLGFACAVVVCVTILLVTRSVTEGVGMGLIGTVVGVVIGNGKAAIRNEISTPMIAARSPRRPDVIVTAQGPMRTVPINQEELEALEAEGDPWGP
jgi:hypothetical protein